MTQTTVTRTFCVECDAPEGECDHNGARYLEDIVYTAVDPKNWRQGHKIQEHERERWDAAPSATSTKPKVEEEARDIEELVVELADIVYLDSQLERRLRLAHEIDPLRVSRLAVKTLAGATDGTLTSPGGFLQSRLAEIQRQTKTP